MRFLLAPTLTPERSAHTPDSHSEAKETRRHVALSHKGGQGVAGRRGGAKAAQSPQPELLEMFRFLCPSALSVGRVTSFHWLIFHFQ